MPPALRLLSLAAATALLAAAGAGADDRPLPGTKLLLKSGRSQKLVYVSKGRILNVPGSTLEPKTYGATLIVTNPTTGEVATIDLPASGWSGPDTDDLEKRVRKFKSRGGAAKSVLFKPTKGLKMVARTTGVTLDEPSQGSVGIVLSIRSFLRYCSVFGGTVAKDQPGKFQAKGAAAPAFCPIPTLCGNGAVDTGEECDGSTGCAAPETCTACQCTGTGDVVVQLLWSGTNDLDLHVIDPNGDELYYGSPDDTVPSGGRLDQDANRTCGFLTTTPVESAFWPAGGAPSGTYTVLVSLFETCSGNGAATPFTVRTIVDGVSTDHPGMVSAADDQCGECSACGTCTQAIQFTR